MVYLENIIRQELRLIMFKKELSVKLLKIIDERKLTVKSLSELANLSRNYVSNIIDEKQVPTIDTLENICSGLNVTPDELLISDKSKATEKAKPMPVTEVFCADETFYTKHKPICPNCKKLLALILSIVLLLGVLPVGLLNISATSAVWDGSSRDFIGLTGQGTEESPYFIYYPEQLAYLSKSVTDTQTYKGV